MNEHELIRFMGHFPDKINPKPLMSKKWKCSKCENIVKHEHEIENPSPCKICDGICFESIRD